MDGIINGGILVLFYIENNPSFRPIFRKKRSILLKKGLIFSLQRLKTRIIQKEGYTKKEVPLVTLEVMSYKVGDCYFAARCASLPRAGSLKCPIDRHFS
jgi:hypothetical protein